MEKIFLGIDVGTGSVRVGAFDPAGRLKGIGIQEIRIWRPQPDFVEQSSEDIWEATGRAVRACLASGGIDPKSVKGLSFDATCSLVVLGDGFDPLTVSPTGSHEQNVIVWMDHRATAQAQEINAGGHEVLKYVGGAVSPEMEPPKLMWLKTHLPETWKNARKFFDLADYMVYRASGSDRRSLCTTVCKWTYLGHEGRSGGYRLDFFKQNGIDDLFDNDRVPQTAFPMGEPAGELTDVAAEQLGLLPGVAVGVGIIDAHAGGIGVLGPVLSESGPREALFDGAIALIGGTSSCHMAVSQAPRFINGVWGPYYGAMLPGMWLNEGGQSATGALIDLVIEDNASHKDLLEAAAEQQTDIYTRLNRMVAEQVAANGPEIFNTRHILPDFHGNRSPRADPSARGMISGLTLNRSLAEVALWYAVTIQAIAYGTRHILEEMNARGYAIGKIFMCGGHLKNDYFIQEHANVTGCQVVIPEEPEAVLLGSAILGAVAAGEFTDIFDGMQAMCRADRVIDPDPSTADVHNARYGIFKDMYDFQKQIHAKMKNIIS